MKRSIAILLALSATYGSATAETAFIAVAQTRQIQATAEGEYEPGDFRTDEVSMIAQGLGPFDELVSTDVYLHTLTIDGTASQNSAIRDEQIHATGWASGDKIGGETLFASASSLCILTFEVVRQVECTASVKLAVFDSHNIAPGAAESRLELRSASGSVIAASLSEVDTRETTWEGVLAPGVYTLEAVATASTNAPSTLVYALARFEFLLATATNVPVQNSSMGQLKAQYASEQD